jgi:hypothetical protein
MSNLPVLRPEDGTPVYSMLSAFLRGHSDPPPHDGDPLSRSELQRATGLVELARARRARALTSRGQGSAVRAPDHPAAERCIVHTTTDGVAVTSHVFDEVPRLGALISRTGPDVFVLSVCIQTMDD